ncbi:MAG: hypothetical protein ACI971_000720 [Colwellia sp.]|jgi:hypothetical protein
MTAKYDFNRLLNGSPDEKDKPFKANLKIEEHREAHLRKLLKEVTTEIKVEFSSIRDYITDSEFNELNSTQKSVLLSLKPRFRTQGSFTYKTANEPAHKPPQQVDIDVGMYLPMNVVVKDSSLSHTLMFHIIDKVLSRVASRRKSWKFVGSKATCGRVETDKHAHIDVVAYAIPTEKFSIIVENFEEKRAMYASVDSKDDFIELDPTEVNVAHRTNGWMISDPKEVSDWFNNEAKQFQYLRNVCRYLKAWRDFQWPNGEGPSSIALMVIASKIFNTSLSFNSDSEALISVAKQLPAILDNEVRLPVSPEGVVWPRTNDNREDIIKAALELSASLQHCQLLAGTKEEVVYHLRGVLGERIPNRPDWVKAITAPPSKKKAPAIILPQEHSKNTIAG